MVKRKRFSGIETGVDLEDSHPQWIGLRSKLGLSGSHADRELASSLINYWCTGHNIEIESLPIIAPKKKRGRKPKPKPSAEADLNHDSPSTKVTQENTGASELEITPVEQTIKQEILDQIAGLDVPEADDQGIHLFEDIGSQSPLRRSSRRQQKQKCSCCNDTSTESSQNHQHHHELETSVKNQSEDGDLDADPIEDVHAEDEQSDIAENGDEDTETLDVKPNVKKIYECSVCEKIFPSRNGLRRHEYTHKDPSEYPYACQFCERRFIEGRRLQLHVKRFHDPGEERKRRPPSAPRKNRLQCEYIVTCPLCPKRFQSRHHLLRHTWLHKDKSEWPYACSSCGKKFIEENKCKYHEEEICKKLLPGKCSVCDENFPSQKALADHLKTHTTGGAGEAQETGGTSDLGAEIVEPGAEIPASAATGTITTVEQIEAHVEIISGDQQFVCGICQEIFINFSMYEKHMETDHAQTEGTVEPFVSIQTPGGQTKTNEEQSSRVFTCSECTMTFVDVKEYRTHVEQHVQVEATKTSVTCNICGKVLANNRNLEFHMKYHTGQLDHQCDTCGKLFNSSTHLKRHKLIHNDVKKYPCTQCAASFNTVGLLDKHLAEHMGTKPFICNFCGDGFTRKFLLNRHIQCHLDRLPLKCGHCNKGFLDQEDLESHLLIHAPDNKLRCETCGKDFKYKIQLTNHAWTHVARSEWPFPCTLCHKRYYNKPNLEEHVKKHNLDAKFLCKFCSKGFDNRTEYVKHTLIHGGENSYQCNVCARGFKNVRLLTAHMAAHSDVKGKLCNLCGKAYKWAANLYKHLKQDHGDLGISTTSGRQAPGICMEQY